MLEICVRTVLTQNPGKLARGLHQIFYRWTGSTPEWVLALRLGIHLILYE